MKLRQASPNVIQSTYIAKSSCNRYKVIEMFDITVPLPDQYDGIDTAAVGGFPRDLYMGRERNDVDLVVTGVTPEEMRNRGFKHIMSADNRKPVFVDDLKREVAIARTEQSTGKGHDDFDMDIVDPDLNHEDALRKDLKRRDLTMNAIAVDIRTGEVFDPFDGRSDIEDGIIRHINSAFREDPLRVVRAARYAARFGFNIHEDTRELMNEISEDVSELTRGRLGGELVKAMKQSKNPRRFFDVLRENNALSDAYPNIASLTEVPAGPQEYHKEGTAYEHTMRVLSEMFERQGNDVPSLLAALAHDIGKIDTPNEVLPHHYGHEERGSEIASELRTELQLNRELRGVMSTSAEVHGNLGQLDEVNITTLIDIAHKVRNSPLSAEQMGDLAESDGQGRVPPMENNAETIANRLRTAIDVIEDIGGKEALQSRDLTQEDIGDTVSGSQVGNFIRQDRAEELRTRL